MTIKNYKIHNFFLQVVTSVVNELDPIGLLGQGAPSNEYNEEIQKITILIKRYDTIEKFGRAIYDIFLENFGKDAAGDMGIYINAAEKIFAKIKE